LRKEVLLSIRTFSFLIALAFTALRLPAAYATDEMMRADKSKIRVVIAPGQASTGIINVENPGSEPKTVRVYLEDWVYLPPGDGSKDFRPAATTKASACDWITFSPAELPLAPGGRGKISYTIKVPEGAEGAHYAALFLENMSNAAVTEGVGVNLAIRVAVLFFVEAEAAVTRDISVTKISVKQSAKKALDITLPVKNIGNVDLTIGGTFDIMSSDGMVVGRGTFGNLYTLPDDSGIMSSSWSLPIPPGSYSIVLTIDIGKALEETGMGRGPVIVKEASLKIGPDNSVIEVGALR
jgi:hypothetical protein